jgi:hypothetical protein
MPCGRIGMISFPTGRRPPPCVLEPRRRALLPVEKQIMKIKKARKNLPVTNQWLIGGGSRTSYAVG